MTEYTERIEGFQIRDIAYFGKPPVDAPIMFDIVKWFPEKEPYVGTVYHSTPIGLVSKEELITEHCYSVATLEWNDREPCFEFRSVGLRWLQENPSEAVVNMILKFCKEKEKEINEKSNENEL